jgi:hypothetical protein
MSDIPNDKLYSWIERAQTYLYSSERVDIIQLLLLNLQDKFGLTKSEWHNIIKRSQNPRTRCKHVKYNGAKCLAPVFIDPNTNSSEEVCEKHL